MMESKEREIKHLNDKVRAMEREYDDLIQKESRERIKADKAEREIANMKNQIDKLEIQREASIVANEDKNNFDSSKFDVEIARYVRYFKNLWKSRCHIRLIIEKIMIYCEIWT